MRIIDFGGVAPKNHRRKLSSPFSLRAVNVDLYGAQLQGLPMPVDAGVVVDVYGNTVNAEVHTIHMAGKLPVAFLQHTFIARDPLQRLGADTFLYVDNGKLWRTSPSRIAAKKAPLVVGIDYPKAAPATTVIPYAGCKAEVPEQLCYDDEPAGECEHDLPPVATSYKFTYVDACGDESAPSVASPVIDVPYGDGVALSDTGVPPSNAVSRRWYRSVVGEKGEIAWLFVEETPIDMALYIDGKCPMELGEVLSTEEHMPAVDCVLGVANYGLNSTIVWTNRTIYVSEPMLPHAYKPRNKQVVFYDIVGAQSYIDITENINSYKVAVLTDGCPYSVTGGSSDDILVQEIQDWQACVSASSITVGEGLVYYTSPHGIVAFSGSNAKVITTDAFTEREWKTLMPETQRMCFWSGRLWCFYDRGGIQIRTSNSDVDRIEQVSELSDSYKACTAAPDTAMYVTNNGQLLRWCADNNRTMRYVWRSRVQTQTGLWYPVSVKVEAERGARTQASPVAKEAYALWKIQHRGDTSGFFCKYPEYIKYQTSLEPTTHGTVVRLYADDELFVERVIRHNAPIRLPRRRRAIHWDIEVESNIVIIEIHMQTSNEDLVQEGGAV